MRISLDTETTGLDIRHGCRPFFVTICNGEDHFNYEWRMDTKTRMPFVDKNDLREIERLLEETNQIILHNGKYDIAALIHVGINWKEEWFDKCQDTLIASHILGSSEPHDLTFLAVKYLRINIAEKEEALDEACKKARELAKKLGWRLAEKDGPQTPSAGEKLYKWDMWLPKAICEFAAKHKSPKTTKAGNLEQYSSQEHPWLTVLSEYASLDSAVTYALWDVFEHILHKEGLWNIYLERRNLIRIVFEMEEFGTTYSVPRLETMSKLFTEQVTALEKECVVLSGNTIDCLPKSGTNKKLMQLLFEKWKMPVVSLTDTGLPSVDKTVLQHWDLTLREGTKPKKFVSNLQQFRKKRTGIGYMDSYTKYGVRVQGSVCRRLHPSLNPTGQVTLRWSSSNPNEQNISKQKMEDGTSIRFCFGPAEGREWWSLDYANIELRIPGYYAKEQSMIDLFEMPDEPPYYGSQHLLIAHTLWKEEFEECLRNGEEFNKKYKGTLYQWTKNGDFAVQYGAMEESGTADAAYHQIGAQAKVKQLFTNIELFNQECIKHANEHGFVETVYDHDVGGSYPIQTKRGQWGRVKPTIPLNYVVQSTAMWCMGKAMKRTTNYLHQLNVAAGMFNSSYKAAIDRIRREGYFVTLQIHDELVLDLPKGKTPTTNLPIVLEVQRLMEQSGVDIQIPLKVEYSYHPNNWGEEVSV